MKSMIVLCCIIKFWCLGRGGVFSIIGVGVHRSIGRLIAKLNVMQVVWGGAY